MSKLVELYAIEITKEGATITLENVPGKLRTQVKEAVETIKGQNGGQ